MTGCDRSSSVDPRPSTMTARPYSIRAIFTDCRPSSLPWSRGESASHNRRKAEPILRTQALDALEIAPGPVAPLNLAGRPQTHRDPLEIVLEPRRRDDLEDPARSIPCIPEGMPLVARLECEIPRLRVDDVVTQERSHPPLEHVAVLVLPGMAVKACGEVAGWGRGPRQVRP